MATRILLSTTMNWAPPARLAGAFAACGATVEAIAPRQHPIADSQALSRLYPYRPLQAVSGLLQAIAQADPDIVVPCDDRAVRHLVSGVRETPSLADLVTFSIGPLESHDVFRSRSAFLKEAEKLGILVPPTREAATEAELKAAVHETGLPTVFKTDGSWGGEGIFFAHTFDEALAAFRQLALAPSRLRSLARAAKRQDAHFLLQAVEPETYAISLQRFVAGTPSTCAFAAWKGEVLASLTMEALAFREPAGPATILRRIVSTDMEEAARRIAKRFRLSGFHGLDFLKDSSGKSFLIEINPRATQICHLALGAHHDLPAALVAAVEGNAETPRPLVTDAEIIALFPQSLPHGRHMAGAYHDLPADDPKLLHALSALKDAHGQKAPAAMQNA